jgi:hypothetical protein
MRPLLGSATLSCYTEDYRMSSLWTRPEQIVEARPAGIIECNWSLSESSPEAVAIWATFRKRWLSRYWQQCLPDVTLWADLGVPQRWSELNVLGIPPGWTSFATQVYSSDTESIEDLERAQAIAIRIAAPAIPTLLVISAGVGWRKLLADGRLRSDICLGVDSFAAQRRKNGALTK